MWDEPSVDVLPCGTCAPKDALRCRVFPYRLAGKRCSASVILFVFPGRARARPAHKASLVTGARVSKTQRPFGAAGAASPSAVLGEDR